MQPVWDAYSAVIPRSEGWRHDWSFRTCVSTAVVTFIFLYEPASKGLLDHVFPPFCAFATVAVKDVTVGATVVNAWACVWGSFISCVISTVILKIVEPQVLHWNHSDSMGILLLLLFISSFLMQYLEI